MKVSNLPPADFFRWVMQNRDNIVTSCASSEAQEVATRRCYLDTKVSPVVEFDATASKKIAEISMLPTEVLLNQLPHARLPWPGAVFVLDMRAYLRVTTGQEPETDVANHIFMIAKQQLGMRPWCVDFQILSAPDGATRETEKSVLTPLAYTCNFAEPVKRFSSPGQDLIRASCRAYLASRFAGQMHLPQFRSLVEQDRDMLDLLFLGSKFMPADGDGFELEATDGPGRRLASHFAVRDPFYGVSLDQFAKAFDGVEGGADPMNWRGATDTAMMGLVAEDTGSPRAMLAICIALGRSGGVTMVDTPRRKATTLVRGRRFRKEVYSRAEINLEATTLRARGGYTLGAERSHPRLHKVRGFWRHYLRDGKPGCVHSWSFDDDPDRQRCACGATRVWIRAHLRGDDGSGLVWHDAIGVVAKKRT